MKRRIVRVCILLLLGAIVNVAVAWGCAKISSWPDQKEWQNWTSVDSWPDPAPSRWPARHDRIIVRSDLMTIERHTNREQNIRIEGSRYYLFDRFDFGLPLPSCRCEMLSEAAFEGIPPKYTYSVKGSRGFWRRGHSTSGGFDNNLVPYMPVWPGFAINTVFYAAVLWGLFVFPFVLRRHIRVKRGLCPGCGYDLRGQPEDGPKLCPECGPASSTA